MARSGAKSGARKVAKITAESAAIDAAGGGPEDPVADVAAGANEARAAGAAAEAAEPAEAAEAEPAASGEESEQRSSSRSSGRARTRRSGSGSRSGGVRTVYRGLPSSGSSLGYPAPTSPVASGATKVIWAVATGIIALEVMSVLTGKYFSWNTRLPLTAPTKPYVPLYGAGQGEINASTGTQPGQSPYAAN